MRQAPENMLSVSQLNRRVGDLLEGSFAQIWVRGEVSNFTQAASGHWYFTLKDDRAAVRAVMFRGRAQAVGFIPKAGDQLELRAAVTLYAARGDYQLQVDMVRRAGRGDLHAAFLALKDKLVAEGLCDADRKRAVARVPRAIGVITSLSAAALRDVLTTMARRAPHVRVVVYPAAVQGADAAGQLRAAFDTAIRRDEVETLLLVRGGGSLEDLWSFNDEALARMVAASPLPVISGVGHETDITLVDFVADIRAATPTAAAELACAPRNECLTQVAQLLRAMQAQQQRQLQMAALRLDRATAGLVSPAQRLAQQGQRLRQLEQRMARSLSGLLRPQRQHLDGLTQRLRRSLPHTAPSQRHVAESQQALARAWSAQLSMRRARLATAVQTLRALNPHGVLERGYVLVRDQHGVLVKNTLDLRVGDGLALQFAQGQADVQVAKLTDA